MAEPQQIPLNFSPPNRLNGIIYLFVKEGDELPVHTHTPETNHISIISQGSFRCIGNPTIEGMVLKQGQVVEWPYGEPHGFIALSDGSKMIQIRKLG